MSDNNWKEEIIKGLLDSGASGKFIDSDFVRKIHAKRRSEETDQSLQCRRNANKQGTITQYVELELEIHKRKSKHKFLITGLGNQQMILGFTWLKEMNLLIDWQKGMLEETNESTDNHDHRRR
jgi:predicted aspartyl protease